MFRIRCNFQPRQTKLGYLNKIVVMLGVDTQFFPLENLTLDFMLFLKWQTGERDDPISKRKSIYCKSPLKKVYTKQLEKYTLTDIMALCSNNIWSKWQEWWWLGWWQDRCSWRRVVGLFHVKGCSGTAGISAVQHTRWFWVTYQWRAPKASMMA